LPTLEDISGLSDDILTLNYLTVNQDLNITGNLFVNGYIYSTVQTCFIANLNNSFLQSNEINTITISSFYNNLYNIKSNNVETNLFYSPVATIDTLNNTNIARMTEVYSDNIYNTNTIVCDNDIYSNNLRCNSFLSLSDSIILNQNLTLQYPFVTPISNQLGYQIIGTIINNNTNITSNTLYNVSSISITHGVWSIFGQVSYKCTSITGSNPLIFYNVFGIGLSTTGYGNYRIESYSTQSNFNVNSTFSDQVVRINTITSISTLYFNQSIKFQNCSLVTNASQSFLIATRLA
jgi:hypothetical protein